MRIAIIAALFFVFYFTPYSSKAADKIQELKEKIKVSSDAEELEKWQLELADYYVSENFSEELLKFFRSNESQIRKSKNSLFKARLFRYAGTFYVSSNQLDSGWLWLNLAHKIAEDQVLLAELAHCLTQKSVYFQMTNEFDKAIRHLKKARIYFAQVLPDEEFQCLNNIGTCYYYIGEQDSAIAYFKGAKRLSAKAIDYNKSAMIDMNIGIMYDLNANSDSALAYYNESLKSAKLAHNKEYLGRVYANLGAFYQERNNAVAAIENFLKAIEYLKEKESNIELFHAHQNLALTYIYNGSYRLAQNDINLSKEILKHNQVVDGHATLYNTLASYYFEKKDLDSCRFYHLKSAKEFEKIGYVCQASKQFFNHLSYLSVVNDESNEILEKAISLEKNCTGQVKSQNQLSLSNYYLLTGKLTEARELAEQSLEFFIEYGNSKTQILAYHILASYYVAKDEFKNAYYTQLKIDSLDILVFNLRKEHEVNYLALKQEETKNQLLEAQAISSEQLISIQEQTISNKNKLAIGLSIGLALLLNLAIFLIVIWRKNKQKNNLLEERTRLFQERNNLLQGHNREKNNIMSIVAHDLSSPFRNIIGLLEIVKNTGTIDEENKEYLRIVESLANEGIKLSGELLVANRFLQSKDIEKKPFSCGETVHTLVSRYESMAAQKSIRLHLSMPKELKIDGYKDGFQRVVDNLLSNAIKYCPQGRNVYITGVKEAKELVIKVKDEGLGFSANDLKVVFKPFQKLSAKPTNGENSTGLGLYIVKNLMEEMDASISLESEKDQYSEFTLRFPM